MTDLRPRDFRVLGGMILALIPGAAFASALPPSVILTLPIGHYSLAAMIVALTTLLGILTDKRPFLTAHLLFQGPDLWPRMIGSALGFIVTILSLAIGFQGADDPMHNLLTLVFWTGVWIALPFASMLFGDLWRPVNPWYAPFRVTRLALGWQGSIGLSRLCRRACNALASGHRLRTCNCRDPDGETGRARYAKCGPFADDGVDGALHDLWSLVDVHRARRLKTLDFLFACK